MKKIESNKYKSSVEIRKQEYLEKFEKEERNISDAQKGISPRRRRRMEEQIREKSIKQHLNKKNNACISRMRYK